MCSFVIALFGGLLCCTYVQGYSIFPNKGVTLYDTKTGVLGGILSKNKGSSSSDTYPNWQGRVGATGSLSPFSVGLTGNAQWNVNKNLYFEGTGYVDTTGDWGVGVGVGIRFKKRAIHMPKDRFHLRIEASPCQFLVYDRNSDGMITREEVRYVFPDENLAEKLFRDLDSATEDDIITSEEFYFMAPKLITGCDISALNKASKYALRKDQQAKHGVLAETADEQTGETIDHIDE